MTKTRLLCACAVPALAIVIASPAAAQVGTSNQAVVQEQEAAPDIIVTGSLIRGTPEDAALPVDVIGADELAAQGSPSPVDLLKALPTSNGVLGDSNQFDSRSQGAEGIATVNLRGLGPQRTLVLLNSRRLVSAGNGVPSVDINMMPQAAIGRIEILKDGAAATYGSDAVAGVVNFITRSNQKGFQVGGNYRYIPGSEGEWDVSASFGHQGNGFRVLLAGGFQARNELLVTDRDFAIRPFAENPQGGYTGGGNPASFLALGPTGATASGFIVDASCTPLGGIVTVNGRCSQNYTQFDSLIDTERRGQAYVEVGIDVAPDIEFEVTALYGRSTVPHYRTSPSYVLTQSPSSAAGISQSGFFVPATNPGLVAYRAQNPGTVPAGIGVLFPTLLYRPYLLGGNPIFLEDGDELGSSRGMRKSDSIRTTASLRGKLTDNLDFDVSGTYHHYARYIDGFDAFGDRVQLALRGLGGFDCNVAANTPGQNGCSYLNPFGNAISVNPATGATNPNFVPSVANTGDLARWLFVRSQSRATTQLFVGEATISGGTGINLPGGEVQFGIGGQYRRTTYAIAYGNTSNLAVNPCRESPVLGTGAPCRPNQGSTANPPATGALGFLGTNANVSASQDVKATYAELQLPVFDRLNLQLGARYEDYGGGVGSTFDPQVRGRFQVTDWLAVRGGVGTTFRGPREEQTTAGGLTSLQLIGTTFRPVDVRGNANLKPESATNYSGGVLLKAGGFSASVDYFRYSLKDAILTEPVAGLVSTLFAGTNCTNPAYAGLRQRFQFSDGNGVAGAGTCSVANIARVRTQVINGAAIKNSGLDFQANYQGEFGAVRTGAGVTATYTIEYKTADQIVEGVVVQPAFDAVGKLNFQTTAYPVPQWKGQGHVSLGAGIFDSRLTVNYVDSYRDQRADTLTGPFAPQAELGGASVLTGATIKRYVTADFNLRVALPFDVTGTVTVNNIFDRDPPFARLDYNYDPFTGSALGRTVKVGLSTKF